MRQGWATRISITISEVATEAEVRDEDPEVKGRRPREGDLCWAGVLFQSAGAPDTGRAEAGWHFLTILEAGRPRSRCHQVSFSLGLLPALSVCPHVTLLVSLPLPLRTAVLLEEAPVLKASLNPNRLL